MDIYLSSPLNIIVSAGEPLMYDGSEGVNYNGIIEVSSQNYPQIDTHCDISVIS